MAVQQMFSEGSSFVFYSHDLNLLTCIQEEKKFRKQWKMSAFGNDCHFFYNAACVKVIYRTIKHFILFIVRSVNKLIRNEKISQEFWKIVKNISDEESVLKSVKLIYCGSVMKIKRHQTVSG